MVDKAAQVPTRGRVQGVGSGAWDLGCRVQGIGPGVWSCGPKVQGMVVYHVHIAAYMPARVWQVGTRPGLPQGMRVCVCVCGGSNGPGICMRGCGSSKGPCMHVCVAVARAGNMHAYVRQ